MNYITKFIILKPTIEETQDLYEKPIVEFFADKEELGDKVEVTWKEYGVFSHDYEETGTTIYSRNEANNLYKEFISQGYKVDVEVVN